MPKYEIDWVKKYYRTGTIIVEADSAEEAEDLAYWMTWGDGDEELYEEASEIEAVWEVKENV